MRHALRCALVALPMCSLPLLAQGNLSTQGYGYPTGQLTARAQALGGGIGEIDASSALNPAATGRLTNRTVLFQMEPEFRKLTSGSKTDATTTARYPLVSIGVPFRQTWITAVSASTFLDRSWATVTTRLEPIGTEQVETTLHESSNGAINDLRLAETWTNHSWLHVGVAVHAFTGRNSLTSSEDFADSTFAAFTTIRQISYTGSAVSGGIQLNGRELNTVVGLSYRMGGSLRARSGDTTLAKGDVPDRFGASIAFTGIQGTVLAARASRENWSSMSPMLTDPAEKAHDSWDLGGGVEAPGPRFLGQTFLLRLGARTRGLPFEAESKVVTERSLNFGSGANFGGGRMSADVTIMRQWRDAGIPSLSERAWTLSFSLTARP